MVFSNRASVRILDLYFDESAPAAAADIIRCNQFSRPVAEAHSVPFATMVIDVRKTPDEMLAKMDRDHRYDIRRALKDELQYEFWTGSRTREMILDFANYYDRYASLKGLASVSRKRLAILAQAGVLDISLMRSESGEILSAAAQLHSGSRLRGLQITSSLRAHSEPSRRAMIGRAHRYLIWRDILRAHESGLNYFDFGGWYTGTTDSEKLRINEFKRGFGGEILHEFSWSRAVTLKGRIALRIMSARLDLINMEMAKSIRAALSRMATNS
jgi:hypothetical protein